MAPDNSGEGSMVVEDSVLRICRWRRRQDRTALPFRDIVALHTALLEGGGQECAEAE